MYFRVLPETQRQDNDFIDIFFDFANSYTEESIRNAYLKEKHAETHKHDANFFRDLGYSEEDISKMDLDK